MKQVENLSKLSQKIQGSKKEDSDLPFVLRVFKLCIKYQIAPELIKSLSLSDLLILIIEFQRDEIETYLRNKTIDDEVIELDGDQAALWLTGKLPHIGGV